MNHLRAGTEILTATGRRWAALGGADDATPTSATSSSDARQTYRQLRFVQIDDFVRGDLLEEIIRVLMPQVRQHAVRIVRPHQVATGMIREGRRFDRIDPGSFEGNDASRPDAAAIREAFDRCGLTGFAEALLDEALPFFESVVERKLAYDRTFLLTYHEADFIAPHGDTQTSRRIMIQMPVTFGCRSAMRVMRDGWMEPYYDDLGALRIHGPGVWHEVLPVLRLAGGQQPERTLVTLRLPYAGDE
jgi:hypothetical protein